MGEVQQDKSSLCFQDCESFTLKNPFTLEVLVALFLHLLWPHQRMQLHPVTHIRNVVKHESQVVVGRDTEA